jgi:predicted S18 family serine protease
MAARSVAARTEAKAQRLAEGDFAAQFPQPSGQDASNEFASRRLERVRAQLERLDDMMEKEKDANKLERLAAAAHRLAEQEAFLSGAKERRASKDSKKSKAELRETSRDSVDVG